MLEEVKEVKKFPFFRLGISIRMNGVINPGNDDNLSSIAYNLQYTPRIAGPERGETRRVN